MANRVATAARGAGKQSRGDAAAARSRKTRILGVDPGLERTGYAVVEMPGCRIVEAGLVRSNTKKSLAERLVEIAGGIEEILSDNAIDMLVVEELFAHYKHPRTAILMGHARGVILMAAAAHGIPVQGASATKIKKSLTGNGHASKQQMQRAVMATLKLDRMPEPSDVADALAIAAYGAWVHTKSPSNR